MPIRGPHDADSRLVTDPSRLTTQEIRDLLRYVRQISEGGLRRLYVELSLQNLEAIQQFERSSSRLSRWLTCLTVVLVVLTGIIAVFTIHLVLNAT